MEETFHLNRSYIIKSIVTLFSGSVIAQVMTALALLLTARQLNPSVYGQYAACIAITSVTSIFFSLGLDIWLLREGGRDGQRLPWFAGSVLGIKGIFGVIWIFLFILIAPILNQETYPVTLIQWSVVLIWLDALLATTLTSFKSALVNRIPATIEALADFIWFCLTVLLVVLGYFHPEIFLQVRVIVSGIAFMVAFLILYRRIGIHFDRITVLQALNNMFPYASSEFLASITLRADVVIIGLTIGELPTGIYAPAVGLINMAFLVPLAAYNVMVPVLGNLYKNHLKQAVITSNRSIYLMLLTGIVLTAIFLLGSPLIVLILGESYRESVKVLSILSPILLFKCISFSMAAIIVATNKIAMRTMVQAVAAGVNILLNFVVVRKYGVNGVAGVYVVTEMILLAGYSWIVWRKK